jgi:PAS domain S-box-containing protein
MKDSPIVRHLFPPSIGDYERRQKAKFLHVSLLVTAIAVIPIGILNIRAGAVTFAILLFAIAIFSTFAIFLNHRGHYTLAASLLSIFILVAILFTIIDGAALNDPGVVALPLFILLTSFFFDKKAVIASSLISVLFLVSLYFLDASGLLDLAHQVFIDRVVILSILMTVTGLISWTIADIRDITITDIKVSELAQRESDTRNRLILQSLPMAFYRAAPYGEFGGTWVSEQIDQIAGFSPEDLIDPDFWASRLHPDDRDRTLQAFENLTETGSLEIEYRWQRVDGNYIWVQDSAVLRMDSMGNPQEIIGTWIDVSERKASERALSESEERFKRLANATFEGIVITDQGKIIDANVQFAEMFGYEQSELIGLRVLELVDPRDRDLVTKNIQAGYEEPYDHLAVRKDGGLLHVEVRGRSISFGDKVLRVTAIRDITERRQAEAELRASEERYRSLIENLPVPLIIHADEEVLFVNPATVQVAGLTSPEDYVGKSVWDFIPSDLKDTYAERLETLYKRRTPIDLEESRLVNSDGAELEVEIIATPVEYAGRQAAQTIIRDISERKRAELELRISEERYRSLIHTLPISLVIHADEKILYINPASQETLGAKTMDEIVGMSIWEFIHPESVDIAKRNLEITYEQRGATDLIFGKFLRLNGEVFDVETIATPFIYEGQEAVQTMFQDITERKQAEMAIRESEEKFSKVFMASPYSMIITRMEDEVIIDVNEWFEKNIGYSREEVIGHTAIDLNLVKDQNVLEKLSRISAVEGGARDFEMSVIGKDGQETISLVSSAVIELQGEPHRISIGKDVTDLKKSERALIESEVRYRMLFENANDAIFVVKGDRFIDCNNITQGMFGYTKEEIIGKHPGEVSPHRQPDGRESISKVEALNRKVKEGFPQIFEWVHQRKDGSEFTAEVNLHQIVIQDEALTLAVVRDITERKEAEQAAFEERQRLARDLHDAVSQTLWSSTLIADVLPEIWEQDIDKGRERLGRLRQLTHGALAEMRALLIELRPATLVESSLEELLQSLSAAAAGRTRAHVNLTFKGECLLPQDVHLATYRIAQEALNNVIRHSSPNNIEIMLRCEANNVKLGISDDGRGFNPKNLPPGTHLGIGIMRERAEGVEGTLEIVSELKRGTKVSFSWSGK